MTALLAGIDWSTKAIHAALIPLDPDGNDPDVPPVTFRMSELSGRDTVMRCQSVPEAMIGMFQPINMAFVESVWIEEAYGNHRTADRALLPIQGAIIASCRHRQVATLTAVEWRKQLGLPTRLDKGESIRQAANWGGVHVRRVQGFSHHHAEALLLALAAREITWRAAA